MTTATQQAGPVESARDFDPERDFDPATAEPRAIAAEVWRWLEEGAASRHAATHLLTLATTGSDGVPSLRTMVLQAVDVSERLLYFHTRRDAEKVAEIKGAAGVAVHLYDRKRKVQLTLNGAATVHADDDVADRRWAAVRPMSRVCYERELPPRRVVEEEAVADRSCNVGRDSCEDSPNGREHFAVLRVAVTQFEWFFLHFAGHRNFRYIWNGRDWSSYTLTV